MRAGVCKGGALAGRHPGDCSCLNRPIVSSPVYSVFRQQHPKSRLPFGIAPIGLYSVDATMVVTSILGTPACKHLTGTKCQQVQLV